MQANRLKKIKIKVHEIIYEADTPMGKAFDVLLAALILFSVLIVMLESVASIDAKYHKLLLGFEWGITLFLLWNTLLGFSPLRSLKNTYLVSMASLTF